MMLSTQQRRDKLEKLLERVRRNRGYLDEERSMEPEDEPEYETLPLPAEPSPLKLDAAHATTAEILGSKRVEVEEEMLGAPDEEEEEIAQAETEEILEEEHVEIEPEDIVQSEPAFEAQEDAEVYVPDLDDEIPAEELEAETPAPELTVRRFEAKPSASGDVSVRKGTRPKEWTLGAVIERAWKLGE